MQKFGTLAQLLHTHGSPPLSGLAYNWQHRVHKLSQIIIAWLFLIKSWQVKINTHRVSSFVETQELLNILISLTHIGIPRTSPSPTYHHQVQEASLDNGSRWLVDLQLLLSKHLVEGRLAGLNCETFILNRQFFYFAFRFDNNSYNKESFSNKIS